MIFTLFSKKNKNTCELEMKNRIESEEYNKSEKKDNLDSINDQSKRIE